MTVEPFPDPRFAKYYSHVPEEQLERFRSFRARYPYQTLVIDGHPWRVIDTQAGAQTLLVPPSGTGIAEVAWETLEHLAATYRVIAFDFPPIRDLATVFAGVAGILDQLGIDRVNALGGSGGTLFLQPFLQAYPQRVRAMVLTTPVPADPARSENAAKLLRWLRFMPTFLIRALMMQTFRQLGRYDVEESDVAFVMALAQEIVQHRLQRENFIALFSLLSDMSNFPFAPGALKDWDGRVLLMFGSDDPSTPGPVRDQMQARYPGAQVVVFEGAGHGIALTRQTEYFAAIDTFLQQIPEE